MISVNNLRKSFHGLEVLKGISTEIKKGDVVCVIGPSGSGKSTFLRCLNRLETPDSGEILFNGEDLCSPKANLNLHRQKMGMVFQQFNLFPHMTVLENLTCAPLMLVAAVYLIMVVLLTKALGILERRLAKSDKR